MSLDIAFLLNLDVNQYYIYMNLHINSNTLSIALLA